MMLEKVYKRAKQDLFVYKKIFSKLHSNFKTPYASVIIQSGTALVAALLAPLIGGLSLLISVSVFFLAIAYFATCASVFPLRKKENHIARGKRKLLIPATGIVFSAFLITQCSLYQILVGVVLLAIGIPIYIRFSPKKELTEVKQMLLSEPRIFRRIYRQEHVFLAHVLLHLKELYKMLTGKTV